MKRIIPFLMLFTASCQQANYVTFNGYAQGTTYTVIAKTSDGGTAEKIGGIFAEIDETFSIFAENSLVNRINRNETDRVSPLFEACFALAKDVHAATGGFYDPTVKPLVDAWGFGSGAQQEIPNTKSIMEYVGFDKIRIENHTIIKDDPRVQFDFGSIAKGLTVDRLAEMLEEGGVTDYMVEVGGEIRTKGVNEAGRAWRIGIDKPIGGLAREIEAVAAPTAALRSIATSGNYRNQFIDAGGRRRVHTIDPTTGFTASGELLSVSIAAADCALADAWATGITASQTVDNARKFLSAAKIEYYIITDSGSFHSPGFPLEQAAGGGDRSVGSTTDIR